jgi:uncharacterized protein YdeI (YjbR/CyaY-like superfamily)
VVESREDWRAWLAANHKTATSIWLVTWKKGDPRHVGYDAIVEEALCFGWIDSRPRKLDAARTMLLISPRKTGSAWSQLNRQRIEALTAAGLMQANGLQRVAEAKQDGTDLVTALDAQEGARANWDGFPKSARRGILEWIIQAKLPKTRAARIKITAAEAARNKRANQWRGTPQST